MLLDVLEGLKRKAEEHWVDHHADPEDQVFRVVNRRSQDVNLGKRSNVRRTLGPSDVVCQDEAEETYNKG